MYKARYIPRRDKTQAEYYRTITNANDLNEAIRIAEKFTRKGFLCVGVTGTYATN